MTVIGIDLGASYSCVGFFRHNMIHFIRDNDSFSNFQIPSYVAFTDEERLFGYSAYNQALTNPTNTVFGLLRLIGRNFSDPEFQQDIQHLPFKILRGDRDKPKIEVQWKGEMKQFYPEEILSMILSHMKEIAEITLKEEVAEAVISVPADFNDLKRRIIKDAATIAGLKVPYLVCSSTLAGIAFDLENKSDDERHVLVYDFGGGSVDVSLLNIDGGLYEVMAVAGNSHLGGEEIINRLINFFADRFQKKYNCDLRQSPSALRRLYRECERATRTLSYATLASINCDSLYEGHDYNDCILRAQFENLNDDLFKSTLDPIKQVLKDANVGKYFITDIVLVGSSSLIPRVRQLIQEYFNGKERSFYGVSENEAVAYGAAAEAAMYKGDPSERIEDHLLFDVTPISLGIETLGEVMDVIIPRNATIPAKGSKTFSTTFDNQTSYTVKVYEGERTRTRYNNLLGSFELTGIKPAPSGATVIEVTFDITADGNIKVSAQDKSPGNIKKISIENEMGRLSKDYIKKSIENEQMYIEQDRENRKKIEAKNELEYYCFSLHISLTKEEIANAITQAEKDIINKEINDTLNWVDYNQYAEISVFEAKLKELKEKLKPYLKNVLYLKPTCGGTDGGCATEALKIEEVD